MQNGPIKREKPKIPPKPIHISPQSNNACRNVKFISKLPDHLVESINTSEQQPLHFPLPGSPGNYEERHGHTHLENPLTGERNTTLIPAIEEQELSECGSIDVRLRPLPLIPKEKPLTSTSNLLWFCAVDRRKAERLVAANGENGAFIIRPSSKAENSFAVTLWCNGRAYNIPIRTRSDNRFALGSPKELEQSFVSIEEMIMHYHVEELILYSNGVETGRTILTPLQFSKESS